jgi:hypothetical protein
MCSLELGEALAGDHRPVTSLTLTDAPREAHPVSSRNARLQPCGEMCRENQGADTAGAHLPSDARGKLPNLGQ